MLEQVNARAVPLVVGRDAPVGNDGIAVCCALGLSKSNGVPHGGGVLEVDKHVGGGVLGNLVGDAPVGVAVEVDSVGPLSRGTLKRSRLKVPSAGIRKVQRVVATCGGRRLDHWINVAL